MIVKIQRPLVTTERPPQALIYNEDRSTQTSLPQNQASLPKRREDARAALSAAAEIARGQS